MKAILMSIQPKWCELIASGKKTIEVRKTKPKLDVPFKVYIYMTKEFNRGINSSFYWYKSGKVIGEFVCDRIEEIGFSPEMHGKYISKIEDLHNVSCVDFEQMFNYIADGYGYGWHISDLVIYDKPKELSEFKRVCDGDCESCQYAIWQTPGWVNELKIVGCKPISRPPQSWCYVEGGEG